jgi:nucleotide-binding universal stress UspA family protein
MNDTLQSPGWKLRRIVAATDFSAAGEQAIERGMLLARAHGARLTLQHVVPASLFEDIAAQVADAAGASVPSRAALQQGAAEQLTRRTDEIARAGGIACESQVAVGRPATELARAARETDADLIVLGAHGAHPVRNLLLGTTAQKLLRVSPCPLLVVKRAPPFEHATVLAPTDLSPPSQTALRATVALLPNATLHVAHAFELPFDGLARFAAVEAAALEHYHAAAADQLRRELAEFADRAGVAAGRRVLHVVHGYAPTCIERWIDMLGADLVAIAAHGKSEIEATFLGSVTLHTVMTATCDVLVLRGAGFA